MDDTFRMNCIFIQRRFMEAKPTGVSILYPRKARSANRSEREKLLLMQTILEHEKDLFSRHTGGSSRDLDRKHKSWADLQELLNQQLDVPRSVDQIKKAFENITCRGNGIYYVTCMEK